MGALDNLEDAEHNAADQAKDRTSDLPDSAQADDAKDKAADFGDGLKDKFTS